jgi:Uma2 family endonuclease
MGEPAVKFTFTVEEYLERERTSLVKHGYHEGEIFAMAGGTPRHSLLGANAVSELHRALRGKPRLAYNSDLQVAMSRRKFVYPDASVVCGKVTTFPENPNAANNPILIVEVLSDSTASYDRSGKFLRYAQMPNFREYMLIEQDFPFVEVRYKTADGTWQISTYGDLSDRIRLQSIDVQVSMSDLYDGLDFGVRSTEEWFEKNPVGPGEKQ